MSAATRKYLANALKAVRQAKTCVRYAANLTRCSDALRESIRAELLPLNEEEKRLITAMQRDAEVAS